MAPGAVNRFRWSPVLLSGSKDTLRWTSRRSGGTPGPGTAEGVSSRALDCSNIVESAVRPRRREDVIAQAMPDGSGVLVDPRSGSSYALNEAGRFVWELCDGTHTVDRMVEAMLERYDATASEVRSSLEAVLRHLEELGVLARGPA